MAQVTLAGLADLNSLARDLGTGTSLPASGPVSSPLRRGDVYNHTVLGTMYWNGTAWRQVGGPVNAANAAARTAISTTYAAVIYLGYKVRQLDSGNTWEWSGSAWGAIPDHTFPVATARQTVVQTGLAASAWTVITMSVLDIDTHSGWQANAGNGAPGWKVPTAQDGIYAVEGCVTFNANGSIVDARLIKNNSVLPSSHGTALQSGASGAFGMSTGRLLLALAAGDYVQVQGYSSAGPWLTYIDAPSGAASRFMIERVR
jgi:hypothetical protein